MWWLEINRGRTCELFAMQTTKPVARFNVCDQICKTLIWFWVYGPQNVIFWGLGLTPKNHEVVCFMVHDQQHTLHGFMVNTAQKLILL